MIVMALILIGLGVFWCGFAIGEESADRKWRKR